MITYKNVCKKYDDVTVVKNLNLTVHDGEFVVFVGPSGCGKTTSLKMINRLIEMDEGTIYIDDQDVNKIDGDQLRRGIGYVIQQIGLFPNLTIKENILVVPRLLKWSEEKCEARVHELLELVGMPYEENAHKYPKELSGGQQQRIGVLRALAGEPPIILMDEPFGALDPVTRENLQDELKILQKKLHKTIIFVTHDMDEAIKMADRIAFMYDGKLLQVASPEDMLRNPADPIIKSFMSKHVSTLENQSLDLKCKDVMSTDILLITEQKKAMEIMSLMKQKEMNWAIVVDEEKTFKGTISLQNIKKQGELTGVAQDLMDTKAETILLTADAKEAFNRLMKSRAKFLVVVSENGKTVGIITKSIITEKLANVVWGDLDWVL